MITSVISRGVRFVFANIAQESPIQLDRSDVFNETPGADTSTLPTSPQAISKHGIEDVIPRRYR